MNSFTSGAATFPFNNIEGSTNLAQGYSGDIPVLLARQNKGLDLRKGIIAA